MKKRRYEVIIDYISDKTGCMISAGDVALHSGCTKSYARKLLDCIYCTGGGQVRPVATGWIYLFNYTVDVSHIEPFLQKSRDYAESQRRIKLATS